MSVLVQVMTSHDPCQASPFILHRGVSIESKITLQMGTLIAVMNRGQQLKLSLFNKKNFLKTDKFWPLKKKKLGSG